MSVGSLKGVKIDGPNYNPTADGDANFIGGVFEVSPVNHAGGATQKMVRRADGVTGIPLHVTPLEFDRLKILAARPQSGPGFPWSVIDAGGNTWKASGFINIQQYTQQDGVATVDLYSTAKEGVVLFAT